MLASCDKIHYPSSLVTQEGMVKNLGFVCLHGKQRIFLFFLPSPHLYVYFQLFFSFHLITCASFAAVSESLEQVLETNQKHSISPVDDIHSFIAHAVQQSGAHSLSRSIQVHDEVLFSARRKNKEVLETQWGTNLSFAFRMIGAV